MVQRRPDLFDEAESNTPENSSNDSDSYKQGLQLELSKIVELYKLHIQLEESRTDYGSRHPEIDRLEREIDLREREVNGIIAMRLRKTKPDPAASNGLPPSRE